MRLQRLLPAQSRQRLAVSPKSMEVPPPRRLEHLLSRFPLRSPIRFRTATWYVNCGVQIEDLVIVQDGDGSVSPYPAQPRLSADHANFAFHSPVSNASFAPTRRVRAEAFRSHQTANIDQRYMYMR